jgi:hypothetical protein
VAAVAEGSGMTEGAGEALVDWLGGRGGCVVLCCAAACLAARWLLLLMMLSVSCDGRLLT